ncbi:MAG: sigma 54-dependent Fis family transcriptional regulator [Deltaproteobacteria bacterium]|nr:sigma 54-dependent Fis family transcriptional regulator [Deltaproteobacteria bacterium]
MFEASRIEPATGTVEIPREPRSKVFCLEVGQSDRQDSVGVIDGCSVVLGTGAGCDVVLKDRTVSNRHCVVRCKGGRLWVEDAGSRNGVYVGGARVQSAQLAPGACFVVGHCTIAVRASNDAPPPIEQGGDCLPRMVGRSPAMMRVASQVRRLAPLSVPVLVRGATGTGKDLVARALHELSPRASRPYVALNAGALAKDLASAELFGHDRGAFTGAHIRRDGAFVAADGGTLFLDEIGELSPDVQVRLLRTLEDGEVRPVGAGTPIKVNVRIVAATWAPLEQLVEQGGFREDLYHRLAVGMLSMPSLAERRSDISALVEHFLKQCEAEVGPRRISSAAIGCLAAQRWPGNVRQLKNIVWRAAMLARSETIAASDVEFAIHELPAGTLRMSKASAIALVQSCEGRVAKAAKMCGVPRSTFRGWIR